MLAILRSRGRGKSAKYLLRLFRQNEAIRNALGAFCRASAISAFFAGVKMVQGAPDPTTLEQAAAEHVLIRLGL